MSYPTSPIAFPTHVAGEVVTAAHLNAYANEIKAVEAGWLTPSSVTLAPWRLRGVDPAVEFGDGNQAGGGSTLAYQANSGTSFIGLHCEPGSTVGTQRTRGIAGLALCGHGAQGGFVVNTVQPATGDNLFWATLLQATPTGCVSLPNTPVCRLRNAGAAQNTAHNVVSTLTFDTEDADPFNMHAAGGATITVPAGMDGWYLIQANASWIPAGTGSRWLYVYLNGNPLCTVQTRNCGGSFSTTSSLLYLQQLVAGDVLDVRTKQTSTTFVPVGGTLQEQMPRFSVVRVA